jgi:hypothetical protein
MRAFGLMIGTSPVTTALVLNLAHIGVEASPENDRSAGGLGLRNTQLH